MYSGVPSGTSPGPWGTAGPPAGRRRARPLGDALDDAALASRIAAFEEHADLGAAGLHPLLQPDRARPGASPTPSRTPGASSWAGVPPGPRLLVRQRQGGLVRHLQRQCRRPLRALPGAWLSSCPSSFPWFPLLSVMYISICISPWDRGSHPGHLTGERRPGGRSQNVPSGQIAAWLR